MLKQTEDIKRGEKLREHILWAAREEFLEVGFERTSMDAVAARARTTKRTVYAHFENKEKLFLATFEFVRGFFLARLRTPETYAANPAEALSLFCGRFMETLLWEGAIRTCRVCVAEAARFPAEAADYCYIIFTEVEQRLAAYLVATVGLSPKAARQAAERLLGRILYPRFTRALFGVDPMNKKFSEERLSPKFEMKSIRLAVAELMDSL